MTAASADLTANIVNTKNGPILYVNGKQTAPTIFFVNFEYAMEYESLKLDELDTAIKHGVDIISIPITMPWTEDGKEPDWQGVDTLIDKILTKNPKAILLPRMGVSWPQQWWIKKYPDEIMEYDDGSRSTASIFSDIWRKDAADNLKRLIEHLEAKYGNSIIGYHPTGQHTGEWFFDRVWDKRLAGFEPPALEAFRRFLKDKYSSDKALLEAWNDPDITFDSVQLPSFKERTKATAGSFRDPLSEHNVIDFYEFQNSEMADVVSILGKAIKDVAPNKLSVSFYGYPFEIASLPYGPQTSGHLAITRALKSPYVDIYASPLSYLDRGVGGGGFFMSPVDSVQKHGKMWLVEDDIRTHLGKPDPYYTLSSTKNFAESSGILTRDFSHVITHGSAVWWMDLFGLGWYQGDEMWSFLSSLKRTYQNSLPKVKPYHAEIAVIIDDNSLLYLSPDNTVTTPLLSLFRKQWYRTGAPVGIYLLDDLTAGKVPPAKMYIFLDAFKLSDVQIESIKKHTCKKGIVNVWMYAPGIIRGNKLAIENIEEITGISVSRVYGGSGEVQFNGANTRFFAEHGHLPTSFAVTDEGAVPLAHYVDRSGVAVASKKMPGGWTNVYSAILQLPSNTLRDLARIAGVHIYSNQNDVITAGNGLVGIHASSEGIKTLNMPTDCELADILTGKSLGKSKSFSFNLDLGETKLFVINP